MAVAVAYAGWASGTAPFRTPADVAVSVPAAMMAAGIVARWVAGARRRRPLRGSRQFEVVPAANERGGATSPSAATRESGSSAPWLVLVSVVVAVELASYFHGGPRNLYPTISSSAESLFRHRAVKAAAFLGWLAGGWYVVAR